MRAFVAALVSSLALPASAADVVVERWQVVGPFEVGSREAGVHPLAGPDGSVAEWFTFEESYPSMLVAGGLARWRPLEAERDAAGAPTGRTTLALGTDAEWEARQDEWGAAGLLNVAVLAGTFELDSDRLLLVDASRCAGTLNGETFAGDPYGAGVARSVVRGRAGTNRVVLSSAGFAGSRSFDLRLAPIEAGGPDLLVVGSDVLVPDLVRGEPGRGFAGVPVLNLTDEWIDRVGVRVTARWPGQEGPAGPAALEGRARLEEPFQRIAPRAVVKIAVPVTWTAPPDGVAELEVRVAAGAGRGEPVERVVKARVREPHEARKVTFLSRIDGSAQFYGWLPPAPGGPVRKGFVVSTHGAGVGADGQAAAHAPKDWASVVAPANRRPFGFDWHDWGRLDLEEALDHAIAAARADVDLDRVHLVGHSMGGHGAWVTGVAMPGRFASCAPSAGWNGYDTYVPFTTRRSTIEAPAELQALLMRALAPTRAATYLENLRGLPVVAVHGGADDNVPPTHGRLLVAAARRAGVEARLIEIEGAGHWWDRDETRPGADCLDSAELERVWQATTRDAWPREVALVTSDLDVASWNAWLDVDALERTATVSRVSARIATPSRIEVDARGVAAFTLRLYARGLGLDESGPVDVVVNGARPVRVTARGPQVFAWRFEPSSGGRWRGESLPVGGMRPRPPRLTPAWDVEARPGSLVKALFQPFAIVIGTADPEREDALLHVARTLTSTWWVRGNGSAPILRDVDVDDRVRASHALVLVGGPDVNLETRRLRRELAIAAGPGGVRVGDRVLRGDDLAAAHWQPTLLGPSRVLVLQSTGPAADSLLGWVNPFAPGAGWPDWIVATPKVRASGWAGLAGAGFFDPDWTLGDDAWFASGP